MSTIRKKKLWHKFASCFGSSSRSSTEGVDNLQSKLTVNEEYMEAFRTKSYTEMWSNVQVQLRRTNQERLSSFSCYSRISEDLLEPQQEIVINMIQNSAPNLHQLFLDYFQGSLEACRICGSLLKAIHQTRVNYCSIQKVIKLTRSVSSSSNQSNPIEERCKIIFGELAWFAERENPLSMLQFNGVHTQYGLLLDQLIKTRKKIERRERNIYLWKKGLAISLVIGSVTITTVALVVAIHTLVGIVAAPGLVTVPLAVMKKHIKTTRKKVNTRTLVSLGEQLDAAAKGVYIMKHDFDTLGRLMIRLHDEVERRRSMAALCVRSQKRKMLKEVVKEFKTHESSFLVLLGELEEHVYLCFLTINRARRFVINAAMENNQQQD